MATKYKAPPLGRAYDWYTGNLVNSTIALFNPQGGSDPELMRQWHLKFLGDIGTVWNDYTGKGVSVGIYDSGVQKAHWDLDGNYDASKQVVIDGKVLDGDPVDNDNGPHGTSVAGLIAAERNGRGGVGVAYDAHVTSVNIFDPNSPIFINGGDPTKFREAIDQGAQFDVVNHSWGGNGGYVTDNSRSNPDSFSSYVADGFATIAATGRHGLGTISVMAAGNDSKMGLGSVVVTDRHAIAVGAYRQADGAAAYYSNSGPHLLVSAPSSDYFQIGGTGQVTTDMLGTDGYNAFLDPRAASDYTDLFGGTSGAAPIVTGVVALMLDANENLGWRDVQNILAASAKMPVAFETGPVAVDTKALMNYTFSSAVPVPLNEGRFKLTGADAGWNGGRMHYSNDYGYGAVDAYNAARMAEVWSLFAPAKTSANEVHVARAFDVGLTGSSTVPFTGDIFDVNVDIAGTPAVKAFAIDEDVAVERVDVTLKYTDLVHITSPLTGIDRYFDLLLSQIKLIAPDGTSGFFVATSGTEYISSAAQEFTFSFSGMRGVESLGEWKLAFIGHDLTEQDGGVLYYGDNQLTVHSMKVDIYGSAVTTDDVYTYTNEFLTMAAIKGETARRTLSDTDGGTDWINAAAVSSDVKLSLVGGQSTSFGGDRAFTIARDSVIENAVTGDGNDTLVGNRFDNKLFGMRGDDTLNGGAGNDTLFGGTGNDRFVFDTNGVSGKDTILDWLGGDLIGSSRALRGVGTDGKITVAADALLLLDGTSAGDTVLLSQNGGAVLQEMGKSNGYFWYAYVSGADIDSDGVIREAGYQPARTAAGQVDAIASSGAHGVDTGTADAVTALAGTATHDTFYLYDAMAGSMNNGVLLHA